MATRHLQQEQLLIYQPNHDCHISILSRSLHHFVSFTSKLQQHAHTSKNKIFTQSSHSLSYTVIQIQRCNFHTGSFISPA